jgi:hypothetical protein
MRQFVLIAAMVITSAAAAQAGESRSLSNLNSSDPPATTSTLPRSNDALRADNTTAPATAETPRYAPPPGETQQPADAPRSVSDTPRYAPRPTAVETTRPAATTTTAALPSDERTYRPSSHERSYRHAPRYRQAQMYPQIRLRPYRGRLTPGRIVAALHRYGIYW